MKVEVVRFSALDDAAISRWAGYHATDPALASPYFHPHFTSLVAAARDDVWVAVIDGGAAFFPFQRGSWGIGTPVGGPLSDYHGLIAQPGFVCDGAQLIRDCGLRVWDFDHLPASQASFASWQQLQTASPAIDLSSPAGSAKLRADIANRRRKLEREVGPIVFEPACTDAAAFEVLLGWKSAQYAATGGVDLFAIPWIRRTIDAIRATESPGFSGSFSLLRAGGRPVAAHFGMRAGGTLHYWFPAYDDALSGYSPGMLLLLAIIEAAPALEIRLIDLGKGDAFYKQRLANQSIPLAEGSVVGAPWLAAARQSRRAAEEWIRKGPLIGPARAAGKWLRALEQKRRFR